MDSEPTRLPEKQLATFCVNGFVQPLLSHLSQANQKILAKFVASLADVPWFANAGQPNATAVVASDLVNAWDDWNREMMAVWRPQSVALERAAVDALSDATVDAVFAVISWELDEVLRMAMEQYYERRPPDSEVAKLNADRGLWPEWLGAVKRDLSWAAIEAILRRAAFFTDLLRYYRAGRGGLGER